MTWSQLEARRESWKGSYSKLGRRGRTKLKVVAAEMNKKR